MIWPRAERALPLSNATRALRVALLLVAARGYAQPAEAAQTPEAVLPAAPADESRRDAAAAGPAGAAQPARSPEEPASAAAAQAGAGEPPLPQDYEGKDAVEPTEPGQARSWEEPPGMEPEDAYLFVPRLVLFPVNLALKLIALPLRGTAILLDRYYVIENVKDVLYNDERTAGVLPNVSYTSGYGFSAGVKAFHDDLFGNEEELKASAMYGGLYLQGYKLSFVGERAFHTPLWLEAHARYEVKPALWFSGYGNRNLSGTGTNLEPRDQSVGTRYRENRVLAALLIGSSVGETGNRSKTGVETTFNVRNFEGEGRNFPQPSIEEIYDTSALVGFDEGVNVLEFSPTFIYDSRDTEAITSKGVYLDMFGGYALATSTDQGFWHYGVTLATFVNLYKRSRTLSLRAVLEGVHGDEEDIPFSELVRLGGPMRLRGYHLDQFRDNLAAVGSVEYRYPVHQLLSGEVFVDAGRVGRDYPEIFDRQGLEHFHYGAGLGFVFHSDDKVNFKLEAAYGDGVQFFFSSDPVEQFRDKHKRL